VANTADFIAWVIELAQPTARVVARAMFGGHGLYADGIIFAIVVDDTLYLKTDGDNRAEFAAQGLEPFVYAGRNGDRTAMSYHRAPEEALENPDAMAHWLRSAMGASLRAAAARPKRRAPRAKSPAPRKRRG
jgi:DNA transformation protein